LNSPFQRTWHARDHSLNLGGRPLLMGIVNVTPDSFSDGGDFLDPDHAIAHGQQLIAEGADILDIGGESTRPGAQPVDAPEELRRVLPVIRALAQPGNPPVSIDTRHPSVAQAAVDAGASIINDIQANRTDPAMWHVVRDTGAGYVCMHMQGDPASMQKAPRYANVTAEILAFFRDRLEQLALAGVDPSRVILDPGIGFGKTPAHNLELLRNLRDFTRLPQALLLGISRKSFLGTITGAGTLDRLPACLACTVWAAQQGVQLFRTHDVAPTRHALQILGAIQSGPPDM
jgi:dihydropteroate synthase